MNSNISDNEGISKGYSRKYLVIPVMGVFLIPIMALYLNAESFTLPGIIPWPDSAAGKVVALIGRYVLIFLPILLFCILLLVLTSVVPLFHPIFRKVRRDWSLVSFLLYGLTLFMVVLQDEYSGLGPYQLASLAILGGGAMLYLRPASSWSRCINLFVTLALSLGVLGFGIYLLYPQQPWSAYTSFPRWWEAIWPLLLGVSLAINMVLPALLKYLYPLTKTLLISPE